MKVIDDKNIKINACSGEDFKLLPVANNEHE